MDNLPLSFPKQPILTEYLLLLDRPLQYAWLAAGLAKWGGQLAQNLPVLLAGVWIFLYLILLVCDWQLQQSQAERESLPSDQVQLPSVLDAIGLSTLRTHYQPAKSA